jgi:hypothetical protein
VPKKAQQQPTWSPQLNGTKVTPKSPFEHDRDRTELLSEVLPGFADDPATLYFMHAGESLLHEDLAADAGAGRPGTGGSRSPFEEVLAWVSRRRVVTAAQHLRRLNKHENSKVRVTEAAFKHRWQTQSGYLRDLAVWTLAPRLGRPSHVAGVDEIIDGVAAGKHSLPEAIRAIAEKTVAERRQDKAFRLHMVFKATLAQDELVAYMLGRIDQANVDAWSEFCRRSFAKLGLRLREGMTFEDLGCATQMAGEGALLRAILPTRRNEKLVPPAELLTLTVKALTLASVDTSDGKTIDDLLNERIDHALKHGAAILPPAAPTEP